VPDYATPEAASATETAPGGSLPTSAPRAADDGLTTDTGGTSGQTAQSQQLDALIHAGLAAAIVICLLLAPGVTRRIRRIRRLTRIRSGAGGAADAWAELTDTAMDHGIAVRDTETPRELAARLNLFVGEQATDQSLGEVLADTPAVWGLDGSVQLERLLVAEERSSYARPADDASTDAGAGLAADLATVISALHSAANQKTRWRATALPASLWPAVLATRAGGVERAYSRERVELSK
jgi:hypothetical protein